MFLVDVLLGWYTVSVVDFIRILRGEQIPGARFLVMEHRLPRALLGALVGCTLGVSGATFQAVLRNPLASPDIVGVTAGASTSAVFAIVVLGWTGPLVSISAFLGTLLVALAIYLIAHAPGVAGDRLVLAGVATASLLYAVTSYLLTRAEIWTASEALLWLTGSLNSSTWPRVTQLALALVVLFPLVAAAAHWVRPLELDDDSAAGLGVPIATARGGLLLTGVAMTAVAVAAAGPVAFVAFLAGPISRRLVNGTTSLLVASLVGALIVLTADFLSANLIPNVALPVGVATGCLGAPFLLYLLTTANRLGKSG